MLIGIALSAGTQPQTIRFGALGGRRLDQSPFNVAASSSAGLAVAFSSLTAAVCGVAKWPSNRVSALSWFSAI